jgi:MFS family permease
MMKNESNTHEDIKAIRKLMEESTRFLSLSGLSGVIAGVTALAGALLAWLFIDETWSLAGVALIVLVISLSSAYFLSLKKARRDKKHFWTPVSRKMLLNLFIPLATGGVLAFIFLLQGNLQMVMPVFLIFYGLALVNASKFTLGEIFFLGLFEIVIGLIVTLFPNLWLIGWSVGFGVLHIVYGLVMYGKYGK